jgi:hypothetical protein
MRVDYKRLDAQSKKMVKRESDQRFAEDREQRLWPHQGQRAQPRS